MRPGGGGLLVTITELAARDAAYRREVIARALTEERRGLALRSAAHAPTDNIARNIARLESELGRLS